MVRHKQVKIYKGKDWFVQTEIWVERTESWRVYRKRFGLNRIKNLALRTKEAGRLKQALIEKLREGFDPFATEEEILKQPHSLEFVRALPFSQALAWAQKKRKRNIAHRTGLDRANAITMIGKYADEVGMNHPVIKIKRAHITGIIDYLQEQRKVSNKRANFFLETVKTLMKELVRQDVLTHSIAQEMEYFPEEDSDTHYPLTDAELKAIRDHVSVKNPKFFLYLTLLLKTGIRPVEALALKVEHLSVAHGYFSLPGAVAKNRSSRKVPLDEELLRDVITHIDGSDQADYVFSRNFLPGPIHVNRNVASTTWKQLVKEDLSINKTMYGLKHTLVVRLLDAGYSIEDIANMIGHKELKMTKIYSQGREIELAQQKLKSAGIGF